MPEPSGSYEITQHMGFVRRLARSLVGDVDLADDLTQSALVAALERQPEPGRGMRAWLAGVVKNLARVHFRREQRGGTREPMSVADDVAEWEIKREPIEATVARGELVELVVKSVMSLDEPYRTVVLARYLDEKSPPEIARMLDRPLETVQTQLRRGLERLRSALDARHAGRREEWLSGLVPLVGERFVRNALAESAGVPLMGKSAGFVPWSLGLAAALLLTMSVFPDLWSSDSKEPLGDELASSALAIHEESADLVHPTDVPMASAERSPTRVVQESIDPPSESAQLEEQWIRVVDATTGRPVQGARLSAFDYDPQTTVDANAESVIKVARVRPLKNESVFDFSEHASEGEESGAGHTVRLSNQVTDAAGDASFRLREGGATRILINAEGFADAYYEVVTTRENALVTLELQRSGGLELRRGAATPDSELHYSLTNEVLEIDHRGVLRPGETSNVVDALPDGLYRLRVDWRDERQGRWRLDGRLVRIETSKRTTVDMGARGDVTLNVDVLGFPGGIESELHIRHAGSGQTWELPLRRRHTQVSALPAGLLNVELMVQGERVHRITTDASERLSHCELEWPAANISVEIPGDDKLSPYATVILVGPLGESPGVSAHRSRELTQRDRSRRALFPCVAPGDYGVWFVDRLTAHREELTVSRDDQAVALSRDASRVGTLELYGGSGDSNWQRIEVRTESGVTLPFAYLGSGSTVELPAGTYTLWKGFSHTPERFARVVFDRGAQIVNVGEPGTLVSVRFRFVGDAAEQARVISIRRQVPAGRPRGATMTVNSGPQAEFELRLPVGEYEASDAHGRKCEFSIATDTRLVEIELQ